MKKQIFHKNRELSMLATSVSALYLLPAVATCDLIHVTSPLSVSMGGGSVEWDVDGDGNNDFQLKDFFTVSTYILMLNSDGGRFGRGLVEDDQHPLNPVFGWANNLNSGLVVGPTIASGYRFGLSNAFYRGVMSNTFSVTYANFWSFVGFTDEVDGFLGFRFDNVSGTHYGWSKINIDLNGPNSSFTIKEWAYESVPNASITVGATAAAIPEPSTNVMMGLSLLAMGVAGVRRWRETRKQADSNA